MTHTHNQPVCPNHKSRPQCECVPQSINPPLPLPFQLYASLCANTPKL